MMWMMEDKGRQRKMSVTILMVDAGADTGKVDGVVLMILYTDNRLKPERGLQPVFGVTDVWLGWRLGKMVSSFVQLTTVNDF